VMVSTVWSVSGLLFSYSLCPPAQPFVKVGARAPRAPWSQRHCVGLYIVQHSRVQTDRGKLDTEHVSGSATLSAQRTAPLRDSRSPLRSLTGLFDPLRSTTGPDLGGGAEDHGLRPPINVSKLLPDLQSEYRAHHSSEMVVVKVLADILIGAGPCFQNCVELYQRILRQIRSIRRSVTRPVLQSLVVSLVLSRLDYDNGSTRRFAYPRTEQTSVSPEFWCAAYFFRQTRTITFHRY